jgi:hypothetical protein
LNKVHDATQVLCDYYDEMITYILLSLLQLSTSSSHVGEDMDGEDTDGEHIDSDEDLDGIGCTRTRMRTRKWMAMMTMQMSVATVVADPPTAW